MMRVNGDRSSFRSVRWPEFRQEVNAQIHSRHSFLEDAAEEIDDLHRPHRQSLSPLLLPLFRLMMVLYS
jgi:hypothetical protein